MKELNIKIEFEGGAELLFGGQKTHDVTLPSKDKWKLGELFFWIKENLLKEKPEMFLQNNSVRPGILVLVNDTDWELLDTVNYEILQNDTITFISTLHGG